MATTSYFEEQLPAAGRNGTADTSAPKTTVEILVSSYSGKHDLYLKIVDSQGEEKSLVLNKHHAVQLLEGLQKAAFYLQYVK